MRSRRISAGTPLSASTTMLSPTSVIMMTRSTSTLQRRRGLNDLVCRRAPAHRGMKGLVPQRVSELAEHGQMNVHGRSDEDEEGIHRISIQCVQILGVAEPRQLQFGPHERDD